MLPVAQNNVADVTDAQSVYHNTLCYRLSYDAGAVFPKFQNVSGTEYFYIVL